MVLTFSFSEVSVDVRIVRHCFVFEGNYDDSLSDSLYEPDLSMLS